MFSDPQFWVAVAFVAVKTRDRHKLRLADTDDAKRASDREVEMFMIFSFYALLFSFLLDGKIIMTQEKSDVRKCHAGIAASCFVREWLFFVAVAIRL